MRNQISTITIIIIITLLFFNSCKKEELIQPVNYQFSSEAKLAFARLVTEKYPSPTDPNKYFYCSQFIPGFKPFHIGDTIAIIISQEFGAQIIGEKQVLVSVTSKLGDCENYLLNPGFWPCETIATDIAIYQTIIYYNTKPIGNKPQPFPYNGELEIRTTGDTLIASYNSYSTGTTIYDTVAVVPR